MAIFYVDAVLGLDTNSGTNISSPLKSITRVNELLVTKTIGPGDSVFFRRGQTHYGRLNSTPAPAGIWQADITFSSYGDGYMPIISGYKIATPAGWIEHATGIWKIDISPVSTSITGDVLGTGANGQAGTTDVGFLKIDGSMKVRKFRSLSVLETTQWDFTSDETYLYVRSETNPSVNALDIRIATRGNSVTPATRTKYLGLDIIGTGSHGIRSDAANYVSVVGCRIREHGGSYLNIPAKGDGTFDNTRFGNGVEVWIGAKSWQVEYNEICDIYDVAVTCQGTAYAGGDNRWEDISFRYNTIWNCSQAFECWAAKAADGTTGLGFIKVKFNHNKVYNSGYSWGEFVPTNSGNKGVTFLSYAMDMPVDIETAYNLIVQSKSSLAYHRRKDAGGGTDITTIPAGWNSHDNTIMMTSGTRMRYVMTGSSFFTIDQATLWASAESTEKDSVFHILPPSLDPTVVAKADWLSVVQQYAMSKTAVALEQTKTTDKAVAELAGEVSRLRSDAFARNPRGRQQGGLKANSWYFPEHGSNPVEILAASNAYSFRALPWRPVASGYISSVSAQIQHASNAGGNIKLGVYRMESDYLVLVWASGSIPATTAGVVTVDAGFRVRENEDLWVGAAMDGGNAGSLGIRGTTGDMKTGIPLADSALSWGFDNRPVGISLSAPAMVLPTVVTNYGGTTQAPVVALKSA